MSYIYYEVIFQHVIAILRKFGLKSEIGFVPFNLFSLV